MNVRLNPAVLFMIFLFSVPTLFTSPMLTKLMKKCVPLPTVTHHTDDNEPIIKWLEVNNKLTSVCDFGLLQILLTYGTIPEAFKFVNDPSRIDVDQQTQTGQKIIKFVEHLARRRLGDDCQLIEGGSHSPDLPMLMVGQKEFNFVKK